MRHTEGGDERRGIAELLKEIARSGQGSFFAVLKTFGNCPPPDFCPSRWGRNARARLSQSRRKDAALFEGSTRSSARQVAGFTLPRRPDSQDMWASGYPALADFINPSIPVSVPTSGGALTHDLESIRMRDRPSSYSAHCPRSPKPPPAFGPSAVQGSCSPAGARSGSKRSPRICGCAVATLKRWPLTLPMQAYRQIAERSPFLAAQTSYSSPMERSAIKGAQKPIRMRRSACFCELHKRGALVPLGRQCVGAQSRDTDRHRVRRRR